MLSLRDKYNVFFIIVDKFIHYYFTYLKPLKLSSQCHGIGWQEGRVEIFLRAGVRTLAASYSARP